MDKPQADGHGCEVYAQVPCWALCPCFPPNLACPSLTQVPSSLPLFTSLRPEGGLQDGLPGGGGRGRMQIPKRDKEARWRCR